MNFDDMINYTSNYYSSKKSYFDLCGFRIKVTKYIMDEYDIPGLKTMTTTPENIQVINNIMISGYNENRGVPNTAKLLADFIKGYIVEKNEYNNN
jgi:hypothetical protein